MQITRSSIDTAKGPADWFTGDVYIDSVAAAPPPSRVTANLVHFMPGARTHWHRHPLSQTVFVTEGVGLCQRRGGPVEVIRPGDRVLFEADEEHWHGAAPNRLMVHLAINEADDQHDVVHWLQPVTDNEYAAAPERGGLRPRSGAPARALPPRTIGTRQSPGGDVELIRTRGREYRLSGSEFERCPASVGSGDGSRRRSLTRRRSRVARRSPTPRRRRG